MKSLSRKIKSDIIFWVIFILLTVFLFLTPYGETTREWVSSFILTEPKNNINNNPQKLLENWKLKSTENEYLSLKNIEKPMFISLWATWCPPCRSEMPSILKLREKYKENVEFILISPNEDIETLKKFKTKKNYNIQFYNSSEMIPKKLETESFPTTFIIDKQKNIVLKSVGAHNWNSNNIHTILDEIIKK